MNTRIETIGDIEKLKENALTFIAEVFTLTCGNEVVELWTAFPRLHDFDNLNKALLMNILFEK